MSADNQDLAARRSQGDRRARPGYRYIVLCCLLAACILNFLDRQFLAILAEPVKKSLSLSDTQLGLLTGLTFAIFYTAFGIPMAMLADRSNRVRIVVVSCALWSVFTGLCGFATSFAQLALARVGVGIGEAGGNPPSNSIIADYFPPEERGKANSIFSLGIPIGITLGAASGGLIAANYGWRTAFIALGLIGIALAPIMLLVIREPIRGRFDAPSLSDAPTRSPWAGVLSFLRTPRLLSISLSAGLGSFVNSGMVSWSPALLIREKGMTLGQMSLYYSAVLGISMAIGTLVSGILVDRAARRNPRAYALIPGIASLASLPFIIGFALSPSWPIALLFLIYPSAVGIVFLPAASTLVQNSVPTNERATAIAIFLFILNIIGTGGGPLFVGLVSDHFSGSASPHGLRHGMVALSGVCVLVFLSQLLAARHIGVTQASVTERGHASRED